jgi:hypothetical protein
MKVFTEATARYVYIASIWRDIFTFKSIQNKIYPCCCHQESHIKNLYVFLLIPNQERGCTTGQWISVPACSFLKSDVYWGHAWAGKRGQSKSHVGCALAPTKSKWARTCWDTWLSRQETCAWRQRTFISGLVLAHTAHVGALLKSKSNNHIGYCTWCNSVFFFLQQVKNYQHLFANVRLFSRTHCECEQ